MPKSTKSFSWPKLALDILVDVGIVVVLFLLIRGFLFAPFRIHGPSMCDNFNVYDGVCIDDVGEQIITSRLPVWNLWGWSPGTLKRGDVVVFKDPESGRHIIKRVIGVPGDEIEIKEGTVRYANENGEFVELDEPYLNEDNQGNTNPFRTTYAHYEVPDGAYFLLGDNRLRSSDSRRCFSQNGCDDGNSPFISIQDIEGKATLVIFPFSHIRWVEKVEYE